MSFGVEIGFGPGDIVSDGDPSSAKNVTAPQFSVHVCCGQTPGWIKVPLGREVASFSI